MSAARLTAGKDRHQHQARRSNPRGLFAFGRHERTTKPRTTVAVPAAHPMPKLARLPDRIRPLDPPKDRGWGAEWRGSSTQRGYGWEWQKLRNRVLARDAGLCQPCLRRGHVTPGCRTVDHITPKARGGGDHEGNCQVICDECHKAKTAAEARGSVWDEAMPDRAA